jgi:hypothetical protein
MSDLQDMRARLRDSRASPAIASGEGFKIPFGVLAIGAMAVGFGIVMLTPKLYSVQRTATLPALKDVKERSEEPVAPAPVVEAAPIKADYAGKSAEEVAGIADAVCAQRLAAAKAQPREPARLMSDDTAGGQKIAAENDRLHCFLTEGTARFCLPAQRRKGAADIINYFKGIEYANASVGVVQKVMPRPAPTVPAAGGPPATTANVQLGPDPRVVEAIEGLLRAGYIAQGNRDDVLTNVPRFYKDRFGRIVGNKAPCPEKPWWAVWK